MERAYTRLVMFFAAIGIVDTAYLSYARLTQDALSCNILDGCNVVALSPYSLLFGVVPLSYLGFFFYLGIFVFSAALLYNTSLVVRRALLTFATLGAASSLYFVYLQWFVIKAFCIYCLISATTAIAIFTLVAVGMHTFSKGKEDLPRV